MATNLFDSVRGSMIRYFVRPNDNFILHSLEKLNPDEYLYRLLKQEGYQRVVFVEIAELKNRVWTYDKLSYHSFIRHQDFKQVDLNNADSLAAFFGTVQAKKKRKMRRPGAPAEPVEAAETPAATTEQIPEVGCCQLQSMASPQEFEHFITGRIKEALKAKNIKTAIVMPLNIFSKSNYLTENVTDVLNTISRKDEQKDNVLVLTAANRSELMTCYRQANLHSWVYEIVGSREYNEKNQVDLAAEAIMDLGLGVFADTICDDEIANLLMRKKLLEGRKQLQNVPVSKIYPLSEKIGADLRERNPNAKRTFQHLSSHKYSDYIRQLDVMIEKNTKLTDEFAEVAKQLPPRMADAQGAEPVLLERVTGDHTPHSIISQEERDWEYTQAMNELNEMIGLQSVKNYLTDRMEYQREYGLEDGGPGHYAFMGAPGTGKTVVARLMGRIFRSMGLLRRGHVVECSPADLVAEHVGGSRLKTRAKLDEARGGVLFLDEAYGLLSEQPGEIYKDGFCQEAYEEILAYIENNRDDICFICAGYEDKIDRFLDANSGMRSRVPNNIHFTNYSDEELYQIFCIFAKKQGKGFAVDSAAAAKKAILKAIKRLKMEQGDNFANARSVRELVESTIRQIPKRLKQMRENGETITDTERYTITAVDIPGAQTKKKSDQDPMEKLNELIGLKHAKAQIRRCINNALYPSNPDERPAAGNYLFVGNPGTGKTTVARLLGEIFADAGLLSHSRVEEVKASKLVAGFSGQTRLKTEAVCKRALGGVLFVDEAHQLFKPEKGDGSHSDNTFGQEALTVIMGYMEDHRDNLCVIFAGYEEPINDMLEVDPGMRSRFNSTIKFDDYNAEELGQIFDLVCRQKKLECTDTFREMAGELFNSWVAIGEKNFGNARAVRQLITSADSYRADRIGTAIAGGAKPDELQRNLLTEADFPEQYRDLLPRSRKKDADQDPMEELKELIGLTKAKGQIRRCVNKARFPSDPNERPEAGNYMFIGNPGTGKTTVARLLGKIFMQAGLLTRSHVEEVKAADLIGGYEGHTRIKTEAVCKKALGGVLFVDEAHQLYRGARASSVDFGQEALTVLMGYMEDYRDRLCVIFAGYEREMQAMLRADPGLKSRFNGTIEFENYNAEELLQIFDLMCGKKRLTYTEEFGTLAKQLFAHWTSRGGYDFGNARAVRKLLDNADGFRGDRIADAVDAGADPDTLQMNLLTEADFPEEYRNLLQRKPKKETDNDPASYRKLPRTVLQGLPEQLTDYIDDSNRLEKEIDCRVVRVSTDIGTGSAFLVSPDGYAVTCHHVIGDSENVSARLRIPGRMGGADSHHKCKVVISSKELDLAILKLEGDNFPYLSLAEAPAQRGDKVVLYGYAFGEDVSFRTEGSVADDGTMKKWGAYPMYRLNGEAKRGMSGCPVVRFSDGKVVGILTGSYTQGDDKLMEEIQLMRGIEHLQHLTE